MKDKDFQLLSRYRDGELSPRDRQRVDAWLERSNEAQEMLAEFESMGRMLREVDVPAPPPAEVMAANVMREIRLSQAAAREKADAGRLRTPLWRAGGAMALVAVAAMGLWLLKIAVVAPPVVSAEVEWVDTELPGASTMVYRDEDVGLTVIWVMEAVDATEDDRGR